MCSIRGASSHMYVFFFFKQKTAYEMRISDWSSDVCSSDLDAEHVLAGEPLPEASEGGDHLVGDEQHVVPAAGLPAALEVALRGDDDAAGSEDRLGDEGGDGLGAELEDGVFEIGHLGAAPPVRGHRRGARSDARRVGKGGGGTCRSRWWPYH